MLVFGAALAAGLAGALTLGACEKKAEKPAGTAASSTAPAGGTPAAAPGSGSAASSAGAPILVGHYGSLTGSKSTFGRSTDNAIKLAIEEVNAAGGVSVNGTKRPVKLISEDTEGKAEKAGTVVTKLITRDKVVAVIGEVASSISMQGAPVCQQNQVPMITPSSTNPEVTLKGDYIFRVCYIDPFQGFAMARFAKDELKMTKIAVLFDQSGAYSVGLKDEFNKHFGSMGGTIVSEQAYKEGDADFKAQLTRIREAKPEAIFIPGYYTDIAGISIQARQLGMTMPLLGGDGWDSEELGKNAGANIEGCFYTNHYAPDQPSPIVQDFVKRYQAQFKGVPDGLAALGYDAAKVLFAAIEKSGATSGPKLRDAIAQTNGVVGVTGSITLNATRDAVKPIVVVERKNGNWVFRSVIEPPK